jgi:proline dehydrogenase
MKPSDVGALDKTFDRLSKLCDDARDAQVRIMIDAEQSYFQHAIDYLTVRLMAQYNRRQQGPPLVFNTYQMYLKEGLSKLEVDLERAERSKVAQDPTSGFTFAAKLVRGAYLQSERANAKALGLVDPINPTPEATHASYDSAVQLLLERAAQSPVHQTPADQSAPAIGIVVATHNTRSVEKAVRLMEQLSIHRQSGVVYFAQLLGKSMLARD